MSTSSVAAPDQDPVLESSPEPAYSECEKEGPNVHKKRKHDPIEEGPAEGNSPRVQVKRRCTLSSEDPGVKDGDDEDEKLEDVVKLEPMSDSTSSAALLPGRDLEEMSEKKRGLYESLSSHNAEVQELRRALEHGSYEDSFTYKFWTQLQANHGSTVGYAMGFLLIFLMKGEWMIEEVADMSEGHSVSKTLVVLFLIYGYSFITLGLEVLQTAILCAEIKYPNCVKEMKQSLDEMLLQLPKWRGWKHFYAFLAVLWCMLNAVIGTTIWTWFWWNHVCKSYHDRTCRKSWIGKWIIKYRDEACYDGKASSVICEKLVSYSPIMVLTVGFVFLGNVMMPLMNDFLACYYPPSHDFTQLCEVMDNLESYENDANGKELETSAPSDDMSALEGSVDPGPELDKEEVLLEPAAGATSISSWKIVLLVGAFALTIGELLAVVNFNFLYR